MSAADAPSRREHGSQDVAIEHAGNRDAVGGGYDPGDFLDGSGQSLAMMRPRATQQSAVDIEKDQGFGRTLKTCGVSGSFHTPDFHFHLDARSAAG